MSIDALASRRENSVANSLYFDDSTVGGGVPGTFSPFIDAATTFKPSTRATSASVTSCAMRWRTTGSSRSGTPSRIVVFT